MTDPTATSEPLPPRRPRGPRPTAGVVAVWVLAALGAAYLARPERPLLAPPAPLAAVFGASAAAAGGAAGGAVGAAGLAAATPLVRASVAPFERSGNVRMRLTLPGGHVALPLRTAGDTAGLAYVWVPVADGAASAPRRLGGAARLVAPEAPGFYRLALERGGRRQLVDGVSLAVLVPFREKRGGRLHGFAIGTYVGERLRQVARAGLPDGFFPVDDEALALPVSKHLRLRDVLTTPDTPRRGLPRYATLDVRLLEKLELVLAELERSAGRGVAPHVTVNSGFRPPSYNATVRGAARDSRHQYGDAADVRIDLDRDGRFSLAEVRQVARAVEAVERAHPDLAGGMGIYSGRRFSAPYVHIDARGTRARWNGAG